MNQIARRLYGGDEGRRMVAMLYLLAPISLVLLNPIGFLLMGLYEPDEGRSGRKETVRRVLKRVATTPLVACTALGALYGLALGPDALPAFADGFLGILGAGFTPTALFFTGLSLVGRVTPETDLLVPLALSFGKCVALPVVIYAILDVAGADALSKGFGFVVGAIPTAPSVLVYTNEYLRHDEALVAKTSVALVVCTVFSTPIIFAAGLAARSESMATAADAEVADAFLCVPSALLATWCLCSFAATWRDEGTDDDRFAILSVNALCHAVGASAAALCSVASGTAGAAVVEVARLASLRHGRLRSAAARERPEAPRLGAADRRRRREDLDFGAAFFGVRVRGPGARRGDGGRGRARGHGTRRSLRRRVRRAAGRSYVRVHASLRRRRVNWPAARADGHGPALCLESRPRSPRRRGGRHRVAAPERRRRGPYGAAEPAPLDGDRPPPAFVRPVARRRGFSRRRGVGLAPRHAPDGRRRRVRPRGTHGLVADGRFPVPDLWPGQGPGSRATHAPTPSRAYASLGRRPPRLRASPSSGSESNFCVYLPTSQRRHDVEARRRGRRSPGRCCRPALHQPR